MAGNSISTADSIYGGFNYMPQFTLGFDTSFNNNFSYPSLFNFGASSSKSESSGLSIKEQNEAIDKKRAEEVKAAVAASTQKWKDSPLSEGEKITTRNSILEAAATNEQSKENIGMTLAGSGVMAGAMTIRRTPDPVLNIMYDEKVLQNHNLFETHPDLMENAQKAMRKYEKKYEKDLAKAVNDKNLTEKLKAERKAMQESMTSAMKQGDANKIAELTTKMECANGTKMGWFGRNWRKLRKQSALVTRGEAVTAAVTAGKLKVTPPKEGTSFWRNLGGKSCLKMGGFFALGSLAMDAGKIKEAYGKDSKTGNKQLLQSGTKAVVGTAAYMGADAAAKTVVKKGLGKLALKVATKLAVKGGGKLLGAAIGSIVPGIGTAIGLVVGTLAEVAISKWVLPKIFKNDAVTEANVNEMNDDELLQNLSMDYMSGAKIDNDTIAVINRKFDSDTIAQMDKVRNMTEKERAEYFANQQALQKASADAA